MRRRGDPAKSHGEVVNRFHEPARGRTDVGPLVQEQQDLAHRIGSGGGRSTAGSTDESLDLSRVVTLHGTAYGAATVDAASRVEPGDALANRFAALVHGHGRGVLTSDRDDLQGRRIDAGVLSRVS